MRVLDFLKLISDISKILSLNLKLLMGIYII